MRRRPPWARALLACASIAVACTRGPTEVSSPSATATPHASTTPARVPTGPGSSAAAMKALCEPPKTGAPGVPPEGVTPPAIANVEHEVEAVRGLQYTKRVAVTALSESQIQRRLARNFEKTYPVDFYARRSLVWQTIGVIPAGAAIRASLLRFQTGRVIGFYNPENGTLVYVGDTTPDIVQTITLAHELTHAVDDQHFGLRRLDAISGRCDDEAFMAALGAVEGSAQFFSAQVAMRFLSLPDVLQQFEQGGNTEVAGVPTLISDLEFWPYTVGPAFIASLEQRGGPAEVNRAIRHFPLSTEQVIHPSRFPDDRPIPVNVPDLGPSLGKGWHDLDVMTVGEAWLQFMLELRLSPEVASTAATGWGGALYRAWRDGSHVAVVLRTVWDTTGDANQFAAAMQQWIGAGPGQHAFVAGPDGSRVDVGFATDATSLEALRGTEP